MCKFLSMFALLKLTGTSCVFKWLIFPNTEVLFSISSTLKGICSELLAVSQENVLLITHFSDRCG